VELATGSPEMFSVTSLLQNACARMKLWNALKQQDVFHVQCLTISSDNLPLIKLTVILLVKKFFEYGETGNIHNLLPMASSLNQLIQPTIFDPTPLNMFLTH
jgi:hypothetical protein